MKGVVIIIVLAFGKKNPIMIKNTPKVKATFLLRIKNETSTSTNIVIKVQKT